MTPEEKKRCLQELGNISEETYDSLVKMLVPRVQQQVRELGAALLEDRVKDASDIAHSMKGSSSNLRLNGIADIAARIKTVLSESGDRKIAAHLLPELEKEVSKVVEEIS